MPDEYHGAIHPVKNLFLTLSLDYKASNTLEGIHAAHAA
jgi:hypothetical protein